MFSKLFILSLIFLSTITAHAVTITGTVTYDKPTPEHTSNSTTLNFDKIVKDVAKQVVVEAINGSDGVIASTTTNDSGLYTLSNLPTDTNIKIRVYSKLLKTSGTTQWDTKVLDNTNNNAVYVIEGSLTSTGSDNSNRDIHASYTNRQAAPFAILGSVYEAMQKIITVKNTTIFPPLILNWSVKNIASSGDESLGQIGTSYYDGNGKLYILGDNLGDADEYDNHIIIHEWTHYFEDKLGRADSIGGLHGDGDHLDIRVAFSEGLANAFSAIITDDPIYYDTSSISHTGWNMNIESGTKNTPGWFSEASVQRIVYDLYDAHDDGEDTLTLGLNPLHHVLIGAQKQTPAFTSLFTFITELKNENSSSSNKIDNIVGSEDIATIDDIYGTNRLNTVNEDVLPLYTDLTINQSLNICTTTDYSSPNKLNNHKYIRFTVDTEGSYPIRVTQNNGRTSDPNFKLYKVLPFTEEGSAESSDLQTETATVTLSQGDYLLDVNDANNISKACFYVSVGDANTMTITSTDSTSNDSVNTTSASIYSTDNKFFTLLLLLTIFFFPLFVAKKEYN